MITIERAIQKLAMNQFTKQKLSKEIKSDIFYHYKVGRAKTNYMRSNRGKYNFAIVLKYLKFWVHQYYFH